MRTTWQGTSALLKAKASPDAVRKDGMAPLHIAASNGFESIVGMLIDAGASLGLSIASSGHTALLASFAMVEERLATREL